MLIPVIARSRCTRIDLAPLLPPLDYFQVLLGQLGDDTEGKLYKDYLTENGINHDHVNVMQNCASG